MSKWGTTRNDSAVSAADGSATARLIGYSLPKAPHAMQGDETEGLDTRAMLGHGMPDGVGILPTPNSRFE